MTLEEIDKLDKKITEESTYYHIFEEYINDTCFEKGCYLIRYLPTSNKGGLWYVYNKGFYNLVPIQKIHEYYFEAMTLKGISTTTTQLNFCITKLKMWTFMDWEDWDDHNPEWENCLDGMINLTTNKLQPHNPKFMNKKQTPRRFLPDIKKPPKKFMKLIQAIPDEEQRKNYVKFFLAVIHKKLEWGKFLLLYGRTGSGKSTLLQLHPEIYGRKNSSRTKLHIIGKRFGLDDMYDKRVNVCPDLPLVEISPYTIGEVKTLTGEDGDISVELKGSSKFNYPINCFLEFGMNELVNFSDDAEKEIDSWMKRVVLCECPNTHPEDPEFKKSVRDPEFLDELFSWAINTTPTRFYKSGTEGEWIRKNKEEWLLKCDPILRILKDNYEFCPMELVDEYGIMTERIQSIACESVENRVRTELETNGDMVPKQLRNKITIAFRAMKVGRNSRTGALATYTYLLPRDFEE